MTWYVIQAPRDLDVASDLLAAGVETARPVYRIEYWHPRKSVVVSRSSPLLPGYLLTREDSLPPRASRHWHQFLVDHATGLPLRVPEADDLIARCERGDFDVLANTQRAQVPTGTRVRVLFLGLVGAVVRCTRRGICDVLLDAGRTVVVGTTGLEAV